MPRSIETGRMDWDSRWKKIIELKKKHANSSGEFDLQEVHDDYVAWLKKTPKAIDYDALARQDIDRADRAARPLISGQGELYDQDGKCEIPFGGKNQRVFLDDASRLHFLGWLQIQQKNKTDVDNAFNTSAKRITEVLIDFEQHPHCKTFGDLRKERKEHEPPAEGKGA